jgi:hypothetical protein
MAKDSINNDGDHGAATVYANTDSQGKVGHMDIFLKALDQKKDVIVDRMNFNKEQRGRYLNKGKMYGYETAIKVLHQPQEVCLDRMRARFGKHETVHDELGALSALPTFFSKYERPLEGEADEITFIYPECYKPSAIVIDLDGMLCDCSHRRHFVRPEAGQKKNWKGFFDGIKYDTANQWCLELAKKFEPSHNIIFCSGRGKEYKQVAETWLLDRGLGWSGLFMRERGDSREDFLIKENILDFEILTRFTPYFMIDDRQQVVNMWRKRGFVCLQCDVGDF